MGSLLLSISHCYCCCYFYFYCCDVQSQSITPSHNAQTYTPFALLTGPQCIPVCCAATMTTPAHVPVTAWTYPTPCGAPSVQLIPCCDASSCTNHHISAQRQFYSRPNTVGISPYHCPPYRHHHHSRHRLPTPSLSGLPVPLPGSVYQPHHVQSSSMVAPASMFSSQQQGPSSQTIYRSQQVSHSVYQSSALLNRTQQVCSLCRVRSKIGMLLESYGVATFQKKFFTSIHL